MTIFDKWQLPMDLVDPYTDNMDDWISQFVKTYDSMNIINKIIHDLKTGKQVKIIIIFDTYKYLFGQIKPANQYSNKYLEDDMSIILSMDKDNQYTIYAIYPELRKSVVYVTNIKKNIISNNVNESYVRDTLLYLIYNNLYTDITTRTKLY